MIKKSSSIIAMLAACAVGLSLFGCAEMEANNTKSLLSAAGFQVRKPETAKQKEIYGMLTNHRVERATYKGKTFYVFKEEEDGVAYVGREAEYQKYRDLCIKQKMAQDYYNAIQMDRMWATQWYGAYGYRGWY